VIPAIAKHPRRCVNFNAVPSSTSTRRPAALASPASLCPSNFSSGGQVSSSPRSPREVMFWPLYISYKTQPMLAVQLSHALFAALLSASHFFTCVIPTGVAGFFLRSRFANAGHGAEGSRQSHNPSLHRSDNRTSPSPQKTKKAPAVIAVRLVFPAFT